MAGQVNATSTLGDNVLSGNQLGSSNETSADITWREDIMSPDQVEGEHHSPSLLDEYQLIDILLLTHSFMLVATSILFNACALFSIIKIPTKTLKCRGPLMNFLVVDMLLPSGYGILTLLDILMLFGIRHPCLTRSKMFILPPLQYVQTFASLSLVIDRLYAISMPIRYKMKSTLALTMISILLSWGISMLLTLPIFIPAAPFTSMRGYCQRLATDPNKFFTALRMPLVIALKILILCIYVFIFIFIKCSMKFSQVPKHTGGSSRLTSIKCTIGFFIVHVLALTLYIPGPLFGILSASGIKGMDSLTISRIRRVLILLYLLVPTADPVIIASKIPPLKSKLLHVWGKKGASKSETETNINRSTCVDT